MIVDLASTKKARPERFVRFAAVPKMPEENPSPGDGMFPETPIRIPE